MSDAINMVDGSQTGPRIRASCRALEIAGNTRFADCVSCDPAHCRFALQFEANCFCFHPRRGEIIQRTLRENRTGHLASNAAANDARDQTANSPASRTHNPANTF